MEVRLPDRLQHDRRRTLHHPVLHRGDAQRPALGPGLILPDINAPDRAGPVSFRPQLLRQRKQPSFPHRRIFCQRLDLEPIHSRCASVGDHLIERIGQDVPPIQLAVQTVEPPMRLRFCFPI